jgi:Ser/Thr protein kinase RdoA (MazF antagonist)
MHLAREANLRFVPRVMETTGGDTAVEAGRRAWELMEWMPGRADFRECPSPARLQAAARALARVHLAWEWQGGEVCQCPAVARRIRAGSVSDRCFAPSGANASGSEARLCDAVARWLPRVPEMLRPAHVRCPIQPCLRDVWHDHLLYEGEELTGLVDYAAVAQDSVAADVARMLGSLVGDDDGRWQVALEAYREVRPFSPAEEHLAHILDRTGVIVGLANWLRWLSEPGRTFEDRAHVTRRVEELLGRVEKW